MIHIICDYSFGKAASDNGYSGKVPDSADGNSQNNAGYTGSVHYLFNTHLLTFPLGLA